MIKTKLFLGLLIITSTSSNLLSLQNTNFWEYKNTTLNSNINLKKLIESYSPGLYLGDNDLPKKEIKGKHIKKAIMNEVNNIAKYDLTIKEQKLLFSGYEPIKEKKLKVFLTTSFNSEEPIEIIFNVYNVKRSEVVQKISDELRKKRHKDKNSMAWKQKSYVKVKGIEFIEMFHKNSNITLLLKNEKITVSYKRLEFKTWIKPQNTEKKFNTTIYFDYMKNTLQVKMPVELMGKKEKEKEKEKEKQKEKEREKQWEKEPSPNIFDKLAELFGLINSVILGVLTGAATAGIMEIITNAAEAAAITGADLTIDELSNIVEDSVLNRIVEDEDVELNLDEAADNELNTDEVNDSIEDVGDEINDNFEEEFDESQLPDVPEDEIGGELTNTSNRIRRIAQRVAEKVGKDVTKKPRELGELTSESLGELTSDTLEQIDDAVVNDLTANIGEETPMLEDDLSTDLLGEENMEINESNVENIFSDDFEEWLNNVVQKLIEQLSKNADKISLVGKHYTNLYTADQEKIKKTSEIVNDKILAILKTKMIDKSINNSIKDKLYNVLKNKLQGKYDKLLKKAKANFHNKLKDKSIIKKIANNKIPGLVEQESKRIKKEIFDNNIGKITDNAIIARLKKAIKNNETDSYEVIKTETYGPFDSIIKRHYYIANLQRIFVIEEENKITDENMINNLFSYLNNLFNNLIINKSVYEKYKDTKEINQKIHKILANSLNNKVVINGQTHYFNSQFLKVINVTINENQDKLNITLQHQSFNKSLKISINLV